jgi:hypothetical protein
MTESQRQADTTKVTPAMIDAARDWIVDNRDALDEGGPGNLPDLVARILFHLDRSPIEHS